MVLMAGCNPVPHGGAAFNSTLHPPDLTATEVGETGMFWKHAALGATPR